MLCTLKNNVYCLQSFSFYIYPGVLKVLQPTKDVKLGFTFLFADVAIVTALFSCFADSFLSPPKNILIEQSLN